MANPDDRINRLEARLNQLERLVEGMMTRIGDAAAPVGRPVSVEKPDPATSVVAQTPPVATTSTWSAQESTEMNRASTMSGTSSATRVLGWTGATAMVLAAVYLIRLAIDSGMLTPGRQVALAVMGAFVLIGSGLGLRRSNREYASLLPAGGIVILFASIYGAHIYYQLIPAPIAAVAVVITCLEALWLGRLFESQLYALFAVVGSYSAPFLLPSLRNSIIDLVVYYSAWSVLFCVYSVWIGQRRVYLLAAYMALLGFEAIWRLSAGGEWMAALVFQTVQLVIFAVGTVVYSVRRNDPMDKATALAHLPALLIFYFLQYNLLRAHVLAMAPWVMLASAAVVLLCYLVARQMLKASHEAGSMLVGSYVALVLFHAGYVELIPPHMAPWLALLLLPVFGLYIHLRGDAASIVLPIKLVAGLVFVINFLSVQTGTEMAGVPGHKLLTLFYALELYAGYYFVRRMPALKDFYGPLLYAGHISALAAAAQLATGRFMVSLLWGVLALACLTIALRNHDKLLGKSSLLIFFAAAAKVLLYDLSDAVPLVRIASLMVLGVTLYVGGWLYRRVDEMNSEQSAPERTNS
jgi:uncharacterized membrane protein